MKQDDDDKNIAEQDDWKGISRRGQDKPETEAKKARCDDKDTNVENEPNQDEEVTAPDCPEEPPENPDGIPQLEEVLFYGGDDDDAQDADADGTGEPDVKKQRVRNVNRKVELETSIGRAMAGQQSESDIKFEMAACLQKLTVVRNRADVRQIMRDLEQGPELQLKMNHPQRRTLNRDAVNDVSEVYSPPRIVEVASGLGLRPGWSLDLTGVDEKGVPPRWP